MVLFPELQSVSVPDLFSVAHTSKNYFPFFLNQPAYICSLSMYPSWTWNFKNEEEQRKETNETKQPCDIPKFILLE